MKRTQERWLEAEEKREWLTVFFQDSERRKILAEMKEKHGIESCEVAAFSFLVAKEGDTPDGRTDASVGKTGKQEAPCNGNLSTDIRRSDGC